MFIQSLAVNNRGRSSISFLRFLLCTTPCHLKDRQESDKMSLDLYYIPVSGPCRVVQMVGKELGIDLNLKHVDLAKKEQMKPEFLAINPEHTVPTLVDNTNSGFTLWESRAITTYLVDKFAPGHTLYPSDLTARAEVNRWLFFDVGTLFPAFVAVAHPAILMDQPMDEAKLSALKEKLKLVDDALRGKKYLVTEHHTVADLDLLVLVTLFPIAKVDIGEFAHIIEWEERMKKTLPYYEEVNREGLDGMQDFIDQLKKNPSIHPPH